MSDNIPLEEVEKLPAVKKRIRSPVWNHYRCDPRDDTSLVCIYCYSAYGSLSPKSSMTTSTTTHRAHLENVHSISFPPPTSLKKNFDVCAAKNKEEIDQAVFRWLMQSHHPFSYVNDPLFKEMMIAAHPGYRPLSVESLKKRVSIEVEEINEKLKKKIHSEMVAASLSADAWTGGDHSYFGILLHLIDSRGVAHIVLLDASPKDNGQSAEDLTERTKKVLSTWGLMKNDKIDPRIKYLVTDTTNTMPKFAKVLGLPWIPCLAHVLNLIVKDAFKVDEVQSVLKKCRTLAGWFHMSPMQTEKLQVIQRYLNDPISAILQDVETR